MKHFLSIACWLFPLFVAAQNDSSLLLSPERLGVKDILFRDPSLQEIKVITATRSPESISRQPFSVWVITGEEILRNGFVTLADVMRAAPGMRVSQPGSAVEGEMFQMRGLSGNQYVKILINDIPIKPSTALGMPIGAQLPIRQAERIEVMYGPAGAIYGEEACAGVVNIILKETERPVFTQADLSFGRFSYNCLDLMFGGKLGRDKNIFRYSIYGSSTIRENSDYFYDDNLFNTDRYLSFGMDSLTYLLNPNYRSASGKLDSDARTGTLPHESRMFGINMTWRGLHFTYHRLARFDRSALGLNPLAVSYANPSNRLAERIETFSVGFQRKRKKRVTQNTFAFETYRIDNTSTTTYVFDRLSSAYYFAKEGWTLDELERYNLIANIQQDLSSGERFAVAEGFDARIESRVNAALKTHLFLQAGGQLHLGVGTPLTTYFSVPPVLRFDGSFNGNYRDIVPESYGLLNGNFFAQLEWRGKRFSVVGGGATGIAIEYGLSWMPRLGILYQIDSSWSVRANVSTGFKTPAPYGSTNTFQIYPINSVISSSPLISEMEQFYAGETGVRYNEDGVRGELTAFWQESHNLYRPGYLVYGTGIAPSTIYGYKNAPGLAHSIWGVQGLLESENREGFHFVWGKKKTSISTKLSLYMQFATGQEWFGAPFPKSKEVLNQPKWTTQFRSFFKIDKNVEFIVAATRQSSSLSKSYLYKDLYQLENRGERLGKYITWDLIGRVYLSNHFLVYFNAQNIFDREYMGLDATGTVDDLLYNPQPGRFIRFGVNYNMN